LADPNFTKQIDEDKRNYDEIVKSLWIIPQNRMEALFGPAENPDKITRLVIPPDFVLPVLRNACVGFPNPPGDSKVYFYRVGNLGRIWEVTDTTGQKGCFFLLCLKTDSTFNPLRTKSDFLPRRKWDLEHLDALRKLIKKALTK